MSARETYSPFKDREIVKITRSKPDEPKPESKPESKPEVKSEIIVDNSGLLKEFKKFEKNILDQINLGGSPSIDTSKYGMIEKKHFDKRIILFAFICGLIILGYYKKDWLMEKYLSFKFRKLKTDDN